MSQRGGAVQSHLRLAGHEPASDLIPLGGAHMVLAVEPLESLRYVQYLREDGVIVASTNAFVNIPNYPPIEGILERIARHPRHVLLDADKLSKMAGSGRSANIVLLGAASLFLDIEPTELENAVATMFGTKGPKIVEMNQLAFRLGRNAGQAYCEGLKQGIDSATVREWIDTLTLEQLASPEGVDTNGLKKKECSVDRLSTAEAAVFEENLVRTHATGRRQLYEHEVYTLIRIVGAIEPPHYVFIPTGAKLTDAAIDSLPGEQVVLKLVSPEVVHKTEAKAVAFVRRERDAIQREIDRMTGAHADKRVEGVLMVEFVEGAESGFASELFVGVRATREFGPVIAAGIGGVHMEFLAERMRPGLAVAKAVATDISAEQFLELFRKTAAYEILSGQARGHRRIVSDGELLRCFRAFIAIARHFCVDRGEEGPDVAELEVNPFAFHRQHMVPLDGRGRLGAAVKTPPPRPIQKIEKLLEPRSIAVIGVSSRSHNFGRVILNNVKECGFPLRHLYVIKPEEKEIDGVQCVASIADVPERIDMVVLAVPAGQLPEVIDEVADSGKAESVILIPGGVGETEGTEDLEKLTRQAIARSRRRPDRGPVFVGPNSMGIQSRVGHYDTFFVPKKKLDNRMDAPPRPAAIISQSGAFIITRLSNLETLDPALALSIGNQLDLTLADFVTVVGQRSDIDAIGVYAEGFNAMDGQAFLRAVADVTAAGKVVIFYKAGRTETGRSAAAGHTASVAGDYDVCQAAVTAAGALVVDTFAEFEQLLELATALHGKPVKGRSIGAISNAGYETVGMADNVRGTRYEVAMPELAGATRTRLVEALARHRLDNLVNARNPLDLTPMANDQAYEDCTRVLLEASELDAVIVSVVPLSPAMLTTQDELERHGSLGERLPRLLASADKPLIAVIDSGAPYDPLAGMIRAGGVPVFRSSDQAIRSLGRYLCHRASRGAPTTQPPLGAPASKAAPMPTNDVARMASEPTKAV
jgi:acyl-CoA synthetase (NDP forming)/Pyruvate/2-oxoacid:ferredoxin oxidoreductase gamma subunit